MSIGRRPGRLIAGLILLAGMVALPPAIAHAEEQNTQRRVLVLYTTRRDTQFSIVGDQTLPGLLEKGIGATVDYYAEHIDGARFPEAEYGRAFRDYLALKYRGSRFDAIITTHSLAFEFISRYREDLFPNTPVVFFVDDLTAARLPNSAGVISPRDYGGSIDLALTLQPDTREVFVVAGNSSRDQDAERAARAQFTRYTPGLRFTYLSGLSENALEQRLRQLPEHAIVYYLLFYQDAAGVNVTPLAYLDRVATIANRPTYSWVDSTLNHGVVGGGFTSIALQIKAVADLAVRVLKGERPDDIPILTANTIERKVDWRQLQRWDISDARVPAGSQMLFRPPSAWERYKAYIVSAVILILAQSVLVGVLLVQRRHLRLAEETVQHGKADLKASRERIRDLGGRLLAAQDAERSRIALELHDDVSQQLAVLMMNLQLLCGFGPGRDDDAEIVAREALEHADGIARSLRDLSHRLYPTKLRLLGLVPALASLQHDMTTAHLSVRFSHSNVPPGLPHDLTLALYRVVQEALHNVIAHSDAAEVRIDVDGRGGALFMTIEDDGVGFDVNSPLGEGLGLISMRERLECVGGALTISSCPGAGTRIEIVIPQAVSSASPLAV